MAISISNRVIIFLKTNLKQNEQLIIISDMPASQQILVY